MSTKMLAKLSSAAFLAFHVGLLLPGISAAERLGERQLQRRSQRIADQYEAHAKRASNSSTSGFRYLTNSTAKYQVTSLPEVPYDVGEMYAGNIDIDSGNSSRTLFFIFQPKLGEPVDEITIWLNGGPGCSSMEGFLQENGPFTWQPGTYAPVENPYSWVNLTNVLWVDQPVGTGYSTGTPTASSQTDIADDFVKWFLNWQKAFGISNYKIYVTGESYAGRYVPYISAAFLDQNDTSHFDLTGALIYDPCIGDCGWVQEEVPTVPFVVQNSNLFNLNETIMESLLAAHTSCGYEAYLAEYLTFPTSGIQPTSPYWAEGDCDVFDIANEAALAVNPCFDIYAINQNCPLLWDVLGFPSQLEYAPAGYDLYFNRTDVKEALHAPLDINWAECTDINVFPGGDNSPQPNLYVLPQVIEATNRVLVANGDYDMILLTNGTLLSIQNMTWNGALGFQSQPNTTIEISMRDLAWEEVYIENGYGTSYDGAQGVMGIQHYERGLMWAETYQSGHMQPEFQPRVAYRHLEWVLNRTQTL